MNALELDTVLLSSDRTCLEILDQTLLPGEVKTLHLSDMRDIWEAIYSLRVRGAPAIGVCAGYALALAASQIETEDKDVFFTRLRETKEYLAPLVNGGRRRRRYAAYAAARTMRIRKMTHRVL